MVFQFGLIHIPWISNEISLGALYRLYHELSQFDRCKICIIFIKGRYFSDTVQRATLLVNCSFLFITSAVIYLAVALDNYG